jgi:signal transduction histidine kinase
MTPESQGYKATEQDIDRLFTSIAGKSLKTAFQTPEYFHLLPNNELAREIHRCTMDESGLASAGVAIQSGEEAASLKIDYRDYWKSSVFHWKTAALFAAADPKANADELSEAHWNATLAEIASTGIILRNTPALAALQELENRSERARQISYFKICVTFPTVETYSESLTRRDLHPIERMVLTYGEACCYASRKDEERFEHSALKFVNLCSLDTPAMSAPAYQLLGMLRQFGKSRTEATEKLKAYLYALRTQHPSPFVRLHTEILHQEDTLNAAYWTGSVHQKIIWTFRAVQTLRLAIELGVPSSWYSYLQYTIAQRSSYSGIYDVSREMIQGLERNSSLYALVARGYYWAEQERHKEAAEVYEELIELIEDEQAAAARSAFERAPAIKQQDVAFCYYYAAQAMFSIRNSEDSVGLCASYLEKFFLWSEYLSLSARRVLQKICRAMQSELTQDLVKAVEYYEEYVALLAEDDYISKIKTLSHLAQLYAEHLQNFTKADEHLQALKQLLPRIHHNSALQLTDSFAQADDASTTENDTLIQLWLTKYSLKATQKVMSSLDSVTSQLGSAFQMLESQNERLVLANQNLVELNNEKNEFLGIVAHDLKNPLASILLGIDMLQRYHNRMNHEQQIKKLADMFTTSKRMQAIITNLLDVNAVDTGKFTLTPCEFDFSSAVQTVVEDYRERATEKGITLHFSSEPTPISAFADKNATIQILDNLISNAVKYSPFQRRVWIAVRMADGKVRCTVKDEGPGLSEEDKKKLFGKYARLSAKPTGGEHSTGLGLSIVKKLAEAMRGSVWCESELGQGASFTLELPIQAESSETNPPETESLPPPPTLSPSLST